MIRKYPNLCKPIQIGRVTFRNRMFSAPMGGTDITNDGCIGPKSTAFYELRGKGGAGAVTVSECMVHPKTDGSHAYHLDTSILNSLASATYTADAIRRHGAIPSIELSHSGMYAGTYMTDKSRQKSMNQWGPSDTVRPDGVEVKALTKELIDEIVASYKETASLAKRAGFEMIMVHGGHGWLINQFLSPYFNKRTDEYGGSLENRCRFAVEVLKAVREGVGPGFPIEFRMSGSEFLKAATHWKTVWRLQKFWSHILIFFTFPQELIREGSVTPIRPCLKTTVAMFTLRLRSRNMWPFRLQPSVA